MRTVRVPMVTALICAATCARAETPSAAERVDSAGVEIVSNTGQDRALAWTAERLWSVGGASDPNLELQQLEPWELAVSAERATIYLLDIASNRILLMNDSGRVGDTWSRSGSGPGELASPFAIAADHRGVAVYDFTRGGFARWSHAGEPLDVVPLTASFWGPQLAAHGNGYVFAALPDPRAGSELQQLVLQDSAGAHEITILRRMPDVIADMPSCGLTDMPVSPLFAPELVWAADRETIAASVTTDYSIGIYRSGRLVRMVRRTVTPQAVTEQMAL